MNKGRCNECKRVRPVATCRRTCGGNYRRAPRDMICNVCLECAEEALKYATEGHWTTDRWSIRGLHAAVEKLTNSGCATPPK